MSLPLLFTAVFTLAFCMIAKRLSLTVITPPMVFIGFGFALAQSGVMTGHGAEEILHTVAEITLVILLFLDAAQIDVAKLRSDHLWPHRMLVIGLPLTIALGTLAAWPFLPGWPIYAVALVAAILAPTDAALGQAVVSNSVVPERARVSLTVESGLNDGLALPAVLLFASLTAGMTGAAATNWPVFAAQQLIFGPLVGIAAGLFGGTVLLRAKALSLTSEAYEGIGAIALAGTAYLAADLIGGNGFISAFVAGLGFGAVVKGRCRFVYEFTEGEGYLLSWGAFLLIGLVLVPGAIQNLTWEMTALILVSLFVVRPCAIWLSLTGTGASAPTRLFFGWFGPRGLATALFALLVVGQIDHAYAGPVLNIAVNALWISALLHGLTAMPGARWYASRVSAMGACEEALPVANPMKPAPSRTA